MTSEIAPRDAKTHDQLASRRRTVKTVSGFTLDVHAHGVGVQVEGGDSMWIPRQPWDKLIRWYIGES